MLKEVLKLIDKKNLKLVILILQYALQEPKIGPYIEDIKASLSKVTSLDTDDISIKATTTETLGFVGKKEGIAAHAVYSSTRSKK